MLEVIDSPDAAARDEVIEWLQTERVPAASSPVAIGTIFTPMPLPADKQPYVKDVEGVDTRTTVLWFTEGDSLDAWSEFEGIELDPALGRIELMAPFTPTLPGTEKYVDELRG